MQRASSVHKVVTTVLLVFAIALLPAALAATTGTGTVTTTLGEFVEITFTDSTIAAFSATPSSADPGPRAFSTSDGFTVTNLFSNTRGALTYDITSATDGSASSTKQVQGTTHTIADWVYVKLGSGSYFTTYETVGTFDASAASYTAPGGFTKDSQGTFAIRRYDATTPADGGDGTTTVNWIYDSGANKYMFDTADKDFSNANGEATVWPISKLDETSGYTYAVQGNAYAVSSVAGAGSNYVPTVRLGKQADFSGLASVTEDIFLLIDFPSGTPGDTYSVTLTATMSQVTS